MRRNDEHEASFDTRHLTHDDVLYQLGAVRHGEDTPSQWKNSRASHTPSTTTATTTE